jgi:hypothetical protein
VLALRAVIAVALAGDARHAHRHPSGAPACRASRGMCRAEGERGAATIVIPVDELKRLAARDEKAIENRISRADYLASGRARDLLKLLSDQRDSRGCRRMRGELPLDTTYPAFPGVFAGSLRAEKGDRADRQLVAQLWWAALLGQGNRLKETGDKTRPSFCAESSASTSHEKASAVTRNGCELATAQDLSRTPHGKNPRTRQRRSPSSTQMERFRLAVFSPFTLLPSPQVVRSGFSHTPRSACSHPREADQSGACVLPEELHGYW